MVVVEVGGQSYYINKKLKAHWDKLKDGGLVKRDEDRVYITDGRERTGKSVFAIQQAAYLDPSIIEDKELSRICFTADEFLTAIRTTESGKCIVFDEAFRGLSSRSALSKTNRSIVQAMMEMGQKNLIVWIVLPSFFMLDLYAAMLRSSSLFHIEKERKSNRRYFKVYNYKKKAKLYQNGVKKGWEYKIPTKFKDYFFNKYPGGAEFEMRYRAKKRKSLESMGFVPEEAVLVNNPELEIAQRIHKYRAVELTWPKIGEVLGMSEANARRIMKKYPNLGKDAVNPQSAGVLYNTITDYKKNKKESESDEDNILSEL